jgi:hypothetical protein
MRYLFSRDSFHILSQQVRHCLSAALDHLNHGDSDEMIAVEIITQLDSYCNTCDEEEAEKDVSAEERNEA